MKFNITVSALSLSLLLVALTTFFNQAAAATPLVRAVLFYRSTCGHCVELVTRIMPPIRDEFGDNLEIFYCDVSTPAGDALFSAAIEQFHIETIGVPTLIVGTEVLFGVDEIEQDFPAIITAGLERGGMDWPLIPGLEAAFTTAGSTRLPLEVPYGYGLQPAFTPAETGPVSEPPAVEAALLSLVNRMRANFLKDPLANSLAVVVLIGLLFSLLYGFVGFTKGPARPAASQPGWIVLGLCLLGLGISAYLAYVELSQVQAMCGPVGHCETVQQSQYARLFGILPIGVVGVAGYIAILISGWVARAGQPRWSEPAGLALLAMTTAGVVFSLYLTFLEPFIIGATCLWCLSSAVLMAVLMLLSIAQGKFAFARMIDKRS
jgi:uncharacterized membrane protein